MICKTCVMDSSDNQITFHGNKCSHCFDYAEKINSKLIDESFRKLKLQQLIEKIKTSRSGKYDCLIGISGGVDSAYIALKAKELGLNALLLHMDNCWNSHIACKNISLVVQKTGFDFETVVLNWAEFKQLQRSLFFANVVDLELATDHCIKATQYYIAKKYNIRYIMHGGNVRTEAIMPKQWRHVKYDKKNLNNIYTRFTSSKIKNLPLLGYYGQKFYERFYNIRVVQLFNYLSETRDIEHELHDKLNWNSYQVKHGESHFTRIYQNIILPKKFNIDKRRCHFSNKILSGYITRKEALEMLKTDLYSVVSENQDLDYLCDKLSFSREFLDKYFQAPWQSHYDYGSEEPTVQLGKHIYSKVKKWF